MDADRFLPTPDETRLTRAVAAAYLAVVVLVWLSHIAGVGLVLITGRSSWTTDDPSVVVPALMVMVSAVGIIWRVDQQLNTNRWLISGLRMLVLAYGSAVPTAWRRLRGSGD